MQKLAEKSRVINQYSDELVRAIGQKATEVLPQIASKSANAKALFNRIIKFRSGMVDWSNYAEANFLNAGIAAKFKTFNWNDLTHVSRFKNVKIQGSGAAGPFSYI